MKYLAALLLLAGNFAYAQDPQSAQKPAEKFDFKADRLQYLDRKIWRKVRHDHATK